MSSDANAPATESVRVSGRHHPPAARKRRYFKAALILLLAVLAGWFIGASTAIIYFKYQKHPKRPPTAEIARDLMDQLAREVNLTPEERVKVEAAVQIHMGEVDRIRKESFNKLWDELDAMNVSIAGIIGEQRAKQWQEYKDRRFGEKRREFDERRRTHHRGDGERRRHERDAGGR